MSNVMPTATDTTIYSEPTNPMIPEGREKGLLARGVYKNEGFSIKPVELDETAQPIVTIEGERVSLGDWKGNVSKK